jgi:serine/threonine-protein kinase
MKKIISFLYLCLICITNLSSQSSKDKNPEVINNNWLIYNSNEFAIQYPDSFELHTSKEMGTLFYLLSKQSSPFDKFRENINLITEDLSEYKIDLKEYIELSEKQLLGIISESDFIDKKLISAHGKEFYRVIYGLSQNSLNLKIMQYIWVKNKKAYVLTYSAEVEQFANYKPTCEAIMDSFIFK